MAGREEFVDVSYRGLELGRRLKLGDFGPTTAYLEHATPMPVGSGLELAVDGGLAVRAVVVRIQEQVAGAELPPGMRIRAEGLEAAAGAWWRERVSRGDPAIPEVPSAVPEPAPIEVTIPDAARPEAPPSNGARDRLATEVMTAQQVAEITDTAKDEPGETSASQSTDLKKTKGKGKARGKKR